jgi:hypothetical protein
MTMYAKTLMWVSIAAIVLVLVFFASSRLQQDGDRTESPTPPTPAAPVEGKLEPREEASLVQPPESAAAVESNLPALPDSDVPVRERLTGASGNPQWRSWLGNQQLIRKATSLIARLAKGEIDRRAADFLAPKSRFEAKERSPERYVLNSASYQRYNGVAKVIASLDVPAVCKAYLEFRPLFQAAYAELGFSGEKFDTVLLEAIDVVLGAPVMKGEVALIRPSVMYKFADPEIERLPPAKKQVIRMGPANTRKIQDKLQAFKAELIRTGEQ